jgi:hypothetical protein
MMDKQLAEVEMVACDICRKEVPKSVAKMPESVDYVIYFCGLECYAKWRQSCETQQDEAGKK